MKFSYNDYQKMLSRKIFRPPCGFVPYISVNKVQYRNLEKEHGEKDNCCARTFEKLHQRVGREYYWKVYPIQGRALDYAQLAFPAYKFVLPEVLNDDWLAIVDWHKFQRDHALHQPLTAYIVLKLLGFGKSADAFKINNESLLDLCVNEICKWKGARYLREYLNICHLFDNNDRHFWIGESACSKELWKALFVEAAYLAAVFHDMGYPWQYINTLASKLEYSGYQQTETPAEDADNIIRKFGQRLLFCPLNGYQILDRNAPSIWNERLRKITSQALRETHGFPGAIGFLFFNDVLREFPNLQNHPIRQFCVEWASMAIMMHDMEKIYWGKDGTNTPPENRHLQLRFDVDPLGCILAIADVLEDFERPVVTFLSDKNSSRGHYRIACNSSSLEFTEGVLNITYKMKSGHDKTKKKYYIEKEQKEYFDTNAGYIDLSACGVNSVVMNAII